jgi:hypothetical protein
MFVVGVDIAKSPDVLVPAYDDAQGVTAAFNKNVLARINSELGGDFDLDAFDHRAVWNAEESRMEMHLVSRIDSDGAPGGAGNPLQGRRDDPYRELVQVRAGDVRGTGPSCGLEGRGALDQRQPELRRLRPGRLRRAAFIARKSGRDLTP